MYAFAVVLVHEGVLVQDCGQFFPPGLFDDGRPGRSRGILPQGWHALSGMPSAQILFCVLHQEAHMSLESQHISSGCQHAWIDMILEVSKICSAVLTGKMAVLGSMLAHLRPSGERIVVVSNSTQVLDLVGQLCRDCAVRFSPSQTLTLKLCFMCAYDQCDNRHLRVCLEGAMYTPLSLLSVLNRCSGINPGA